MFKIIERVLRRDVDATPGPWRWWTSNSFRRLSSDATGKDGDVLRGTVHPYDRHPDVIASDEDKALIEEYRTDAPLLAAALYEALGYLEHDMSQGVEKAKATYQRVKNILQEK